MKTLTIPLLVTTFALSVPLLRAAEISFNTAGLTTSEVTLPTNWVGGTAPGAADIAAWKTDVDAVLAGNQESRGGILTIASPVSWLGLRHEDSAGTLTLGGADITLGASGITEVRFETLNINNNIILGANQTWTNTAALNVSGSVSGAFGLTKAGTGILTLTGANTFTGPVAVSQGTLSVASLNSVVGGSSTSNLGAPLTVADGTIALSGAAQGTLSYTGTGETTDRVIRFANGSGGVINQNGTGTLNFTSNMTGAAAAMGVTLGGNGNGSINGIVNTTALLNFNKAGTGTWTVSGNITPNGGNIRPQGGILAFSPSSSTTGAAIISGRTVGSVLKIGSGSGVVTSTANTNGILAGWATYGDNTWAVTNGASAISGLSSFTVDTWAAGNNTDVTLAGAAPASGSTTNSLRFNEAGAKTLTLSGLNHVSSGGILVTANVGSNATLMTGGSLSSGSTTTELVIHQNNPTGALTIGSIIGGLSQGSGTTSGSTTVTVASSSNFYVGMSVTGTGIAANSTVASIVNGTTITLNNAATVTGAPTLNFFSNNGITLTGAGTTIFTGANVYTGNTNIQEGTLEVRNRGAGAANYILGQNGTLRVGQGIGQGYNAGVTVNGSGTAAATGLYLELGRNINFQNGGGIVLASGPTTVRTYGAGANAILSGFDVNGTHLTVQAAASGSSYVSTINLSGGSFGYVMNIAAGANTATGDMTINGLLTGNTTFRKNGTGSLILTGAGTNTGSLDIRDGSVTLTGGANRLGTGSSVILGNGTTSGKLLLAGISQIVTNLSNAGTGTANDVVGNSPTLSTLTVNWNGTPAVVGPPAVAANPTAIQVFSGRLGGTGINENNLSFVKSGTGTYTFTGANSYTGSTTISGGVLSLGAVNVLPDVSSVVLNGGTLLTGGFTESAGTLSLTANSTISLGGTSILTFSGLTAAGFDTNTLQVWNWTGTTGGGGMERLTVPDGSLNPAQLANISFFSGDGTGSLGTASFAPGGTGELVPVPEPSPLMAVLALSGASLTRRRRCPLPPDPAGC